MNQKLLWVVSGFFAGILFRSFFDLGWAFLGLCLLFSLAFAFLRYWPVALVCLGLCLGLARYEVSDHVAPPPSGDAAIMVTEPEEKDTYTRYTVEFENGTKVLAIVSGLAEFEYGDRVSVSGKVKPVENFESEDGTVFDWKSYLAKDEIYYESAFPNLALVERDQGNWLRARLLDVKHAFLNQVAKRVAEPQASLAGGLVLGAKQSLGKELLDEFRVAGLVHMVVLSGYNITIVALAVMWLFRKFLSQRVSVAAGIVAIILFGLMTGGSSTVVRASVMAILGLLAQATGRTNAVTRALVFAALVMVLINPKVLVFDLGFQLSFLATLGLLYLEPIFASLKFIQKLPEKVFGLEFRAIASATLGAQAAVFPLILYTFGNFSVYAFPVNMLVLPLVPITMLLVFLTGLLGFIPLISLVAYPLAWASYALLAYMLGLVHVVSNLPFANLQFTHVPPVIVLVLYGILIWLVVKFGNKEEVGLT